MKKKKTEKLDVIFQRYVEREKKEEAFLRHDWMHEILEEEIGTNKDALYTVKAELEAYKRNTDINSYLSMAALVVSVTALIVTVLCQLLPQDASTFLKVTVVLMGYLPAILVIITIRAIMKKMKKTKLHAFIEICVNEFKI